MVAENLAAEPDASKATRLKHIALRNRHAFGFTFDELDTASCAARLGPRLSFGISNRTASAERRAGQHRTPRAVGSGGALKQSIVIVAPHGVVPREGYKSLRRSSNIAHPLAPSRTSAVSVPRVTLFNLKAFTTVTWPVVHGLPKTLGNCPSPPSLKELK